MPKIAISYRRADSSPIAGRILDHLVAHWGAESVFMDIDDIPFGVDFRAHIHDALEKADALIVLIGANWLAGMRIKENDDPVRVEIATALKRKMLVIPVLIDGAKMPSGADLPAELGNFAFLNAADVSSGRDFRTHMDRLIDAIDRTASGRPHVAASRPKPDRVLGAIADAPAMALNPYLNDGLRYFAVPLVLLLIAHHVIVNAFDLNTAYLQTVCAVLPFAFGFAISWVSGRGARSAFTFAIAIGIATAAGMTVSQSLYSGDPIIPQTRFEWWDNINFVTIIAFGFMVGHVAARTLRAALLVRDSKQ
jgi:hypothetical protein